MSTQTAAGPQRGCRNCHAAVSDRFRRVFGTNDGTVHCCPACANAAAYIAGGAAHPDRLVDDPRTGNLTVESQYRRSAHPDALPGGEV
jgi:hypothetical protein